MNGGANKPEQQAPAMDLMPIQFSHKVIMMCIEELKLRGLRQPHLFRNAFHAPSVEAALSTLANPQKTHLFSVKMMRIDTVAGLLTTALSRTYPPLIPPHIQEMFHSPNGRFFFELLGMLPELNRYLFVEILDLCCALVDQQAYNQISHSKLAVFPGSCCFGLNEYRPNWDARYLMSADLKKFSSAFYHAIYAYREERDLTEEELQEKLNMRARLLEEERIAALERQHGYKGAQAILKMEARIAQGLPAESPNAMKEISLYAGRKEKVVADDAISILDIQLEDNEDGVSKVPDLSRVMEEEEEEVENVQAVIRDLRRSVSVASLGKSLYENQPRPSISSFASSSSTSTAGTPGSYSRSGYMSPITPASPMSAASPTSPMSPKSIFSGSGLLSRSNTIARSVPLKPHPVSPGDIFGISQRAMEKRELEGFLAVARTVKKRKPAFSKRTMQQRQMHKMRVLAAQDSSSSSLATISTKSFRIIRRNTRHHVSQATIVPSTGVRPCPPLPTAADLRRERAKKLRKDLETYLVNGLSHEEAIAAREADLKQRKRKERRAKRAALAKAEAEREAAAAAAVADAIAQHGLMRNASGELTEEEAEILEAFDYLSDEEFREFMSLAGLTIEDIEAVRAKAAALSLSKVTQDIQSVEIKTVSAPIPAAPQTMTKKDQAAAPRDDTTSQSSDNEKDNAESANAHNTSSDTGTNNRPFRIPHMTSMDMMFKRASVIGDANLRLYPTRPSSPTISDYESDSMHGGLLSRAASVMRIHAVEEDDYDDQDAEYEEEDSIEYSMVHPSYAAPMVPFAPRPVLAPKAMVPFTNTSIQMQASMGEQQHEMDLVTPQQQINNHQYHRQVQVAESMEHPPVQDMFTFETVMDYGEDEQATDEAVQEETEDETELRELLEAMSEEERSEFLRLSSQDNMPMSAAPGVLVRQ
ncbi:hypothetical protein BGZ54_003211 [Gamsiella multidivaricata]|nr:hypothetical protein BGZ54_003211 [Gamsiella multidivaricata]